MMLAGTWLALVAQASAGTLAVGAGSQEAVDRATEVGAPAPVRGATLAELVGSGHAPRAYGVGQPPACAAGSVTNESVLEAVDRIASRMAYARFDEAKADLDPTVARLACLSEPAAPSTLAKLFYYEGVVAYAAGDAAAGDRAYGRALAFQPDLAWDAMFAPEYGEAAFAGIRAGKGLGSAELYVSADLLAGHQLWVDGRSRIGPAPHLVSKGDHLVQLIGATVRTVEVSVDGPVVIALPSQAAATWLPDGSAPTVELAIVAAAAAPGDEVYAVSAREIYRLEKGSWVAVKPAPRDRDRDRGGGNKAGLPLIAGGGLAAGSGAVFFQIATTRGWAWRDLYAQSAPGSAEASESLAHWETAKNAQYLYGGLALGGLALTCAGVGIQLSDGDGLAALPLLLHGGGGASLGGRF